MAFKGNLDYPNRVSYTTNSPANINYVMGEGLFQSYDGLKLHPPGDSSWRKYPNTAPLKKNPIYVPFNSGSPLSNEEVPVDIPNDSMFMFAKNFASPYCCPATYSSDQGCVCTTKKQRDLIGLYRGYNKDWQGNPDV